MPYCSSEGHFQGYEDDLEIEVDSAEVTDITNTEGNQFTISTSTDLTLNRLCAGCSQTSATAQLTIEVSVDHECTKFEEGGDEPEFEFDEPETSTTDRNETKDARGKPIPARFSKRFLGAEISGSVTCSLCEESIIIEGSDELQASGFEVEQH